MTDDDLDRWLKVTNEDIIETLDAAVDTDVDLLRVKASADHEMAGCYFDEMIAPNLRMVGTPPEGIAHLRRRYTADIVKLKAMAEIRAWWTERFTLFSPGARSAGLNRPQD